MTLSEPRPYKNTKRGSRTIYMTGTRTIYMTLFTFTSVVQILDYVDKNHMNTHCFRCSDLEINNNNKIKHYSSFYVGSANK